MSETVENFKVLEITNSQEKNRLRLSFIAYFPFYATLTLVKGGEGQGALFFASCPSRL